eukprot:1144464-Pelagomonas_calceolata.AAC.8
MPLRQAATKPLSSCAIQACLMSPSHGRACRGAAPAPPEQAGPSSCRWQNCLYGHMTELLQQNRGSRSPKRLRASLDAGLLPAWTLECSLSTER